MSKRSEKNDLRLDSKRFKREDLKPTTDDDYRRLHPIIEELGDSYLVARDPKIRNVIMESFSELGLFNLSSEHNLDCSNLDRFCYRHHFDFEAGGSFETHSVSLTSFEKLLVFYDVFFSGVGLAETLLTVPLFQNLKKCGLDLSMQFSKRYGYDISRGDTLLMLGLLQKPRLELTAYFISNNPDKEYVNVQNEYGETALTKMCTYIVNGGDNDFVLEVIELLLVNGANPNVVTINGETALSMLVKKWYNNNYDFNPKNQEESVDIVEPNPETRFYLERIMGLLLRHGAISIPETDIPVIQEAHRKQVLTTLNELRGSTQYPLNPEINKLIASHLHFESAKSVLRKLHRTGLDVDTTLSEEDAKKYLRKVKKIVSEAYRILN